MKALVVVEKSVLTAMFISIEEGAKEIYTSTLVVLLLVYKWAVFVVSRIRITRRSGSKERCRTRSAAC